METSNAPARPKVGDRLRLTRKVGTARTARQQHTATTVDPKWLAEQQAAGRTRASMAAELGCSVSKLDAIRRQHGLTAPKGSYEHRRRMALAQGRTYKPAQVTVDANWLADQQAAGRTRGAIAEALGISKPQLDVIRRQHGLTTERGSDAHQQLVLRTRGSDADAASTTTLRSKAAMEDLYVHRKLTTRQIGKMLGVECATVARWVDKHGIPLRQGRDAMTASQLTVLTDGALLRTALDRQPDRTTAHVTLAKELGVTITTVRTWMAHHEIPKALPRSWPLRHKHWLEQMNAQYSQREIGRLLGVDGSAVTRAMAAHGIPSRVAAQTAARTT